MFRRLAFPTPPGDRNARGCCEQGLKLYRKSPGLKPVCCSIAWQTKADYNVL